VQLTDWNDPDPAEVHHPTTDAEWDAALSRYLGSLNDAPLRRCVEVARSHGAATLVVETRVTRTDDAQLSPADRAAVTRKWPAAQVSSDGAAALAVVTMIAGTLSPPGKSDRTASARADSAEAGTGTGERSPDSPLPITASSPPETTITSTARTQDKRRDMMTIFQILNC
jgi:hypothetical protein